MENENTINILNSLVVINHDRINGYKTAMDEIKDDEKLKESFFKFQQTSFSCNVALGAEIIKLGGIVEEGTKNSGKIHRTWMDFKAMVNGHDRKGILSSCAFGDEAAISTYKDALDDETEYLTAAQQAMLNSQLALITSDCINVKMLMDQTIDA